MPGVRRPPPPHGERRRYLQGCHCDDCKAANTAYIREWRGGWHGTHGNPTAAGIERRWQALELPDWD